MSLILPLSFAGLKRMVGTSPATENRAAPPCRCSQTTAAADLDGTRVLEIRARGGPDRTELAQAVPSGAAEFVGCRIARRQIEGLLRDHAHQAERDDQGGRTGEDRPSHGCHDWLSLIGGIRRSPPGSCRRVLLEQKRSGTSNQRGGDRLTDVAGVCSAA